MAKKKRRGNKENKKKRRTIIEKTQDILKRLKLKIKDLTEYP